jgi:hypothetical protein
LNAHLVEQHRAAIVIAAASPHPLESMTLNLTNRSAANNLLGAINPTVVGPPRERSKDEFRGADPQGHAGLECCLIDSPAIDPGAVSAPQITDLPTPILRITLERCMPTTCQSIGNDNASISGTAEGVLPMRIENKTWPVPTANPHDQGGFQPYRC